MPVLLSPSRAERTDWSKRSGVVRDKGFLVDLEPTQPKMAHLIKEAGLHSAHLLQQVRAGRTPL